MTNTDFTIPIAPDLLPDETAMSVDEATELIFNAKGWPLLGGPSGRGWSFFGVAQRCARLFQATYDAGPRDEAIRQEVGGVVPAPLQIGGLYHTLHALYYAAELGGHAVVAPDRGGLCAPSVAGRGRQRKWSVPPDAVEQFLVALKEMCGLGDLEATLEASLAGEEKPARRPSPTVVLEAERLFEAHARHWQSEDLAPLAIEWFAADERLGYSCRYDMIGRVGGGDAVIPPGVYVFERKTAKWIDEAYLEGWSLDGEILGQLLLWKAGGCEERFGPLTGLVMDVVGKTKIPECRRVVFPPNLPAVDAHARWVQMTKANIALWRAMQVYPQSFANCWSRYGRCAQWQNCALGLKPTSKQEP